MAIRKPDKEDPEMVDTTRLNDLISKSGIRKELIAGAVGVSISTLNNKLSKRTDFRIEEAQTISNILGIDKTTMIDIFFMDEVGKMPTKGERAI